MAKQSLLWTAMPNGLNENKELKISILLSPRLDAENAPQNLSSFNDFVNWPETLANCKFTLHFNQQQVSFTGNQSQGSCRIDLAYGGADASIWQALLPSTTRVDGFNFEDMSARKILSYSSTKMAERQKHLYRALAAQADDQLPEIQQVLKTPEWDELINDINLLDREYDSEYPNHLHRDIEKQFDDFIKDFKSSSLSQTQRDLLLFQLFHTPLGHQQTANYQGLTDKPEKANTQWRKVKRQALPSEQQLAEMYDFHQVVAAMNQYPTLLRRMGLVIDALVEPDVFNPSSNALLHVEVDLPAPRGRRRVNRSPSVSTRVQCALQRDNFSMLSSQQPAKHKVSVNKGLLDISIEHFDLLQHDIDGSGIKAINTARSLVRQKTDQKRLDPTTRAERTTGVAALRNAGLMLVQRERELDLAQRFNNSNVLNNEFTAALQAPNGPSTNQLPITHAEDLVRGYRFDIWDDVSNQWHSLCQRNCAYQVANNPVLNVQEEGIVRLAATQSADRTSHPEIISLHEMLMSWTGWSLCAPMPGKIVDNQDKVNDQGANVPAGVPLRTRFQASPGTLPRLRYGRRYWVRARAVDLAGNSLAPNPRDWQNEQPEIHAQPYLRYEPIKAPVIALVKPTQGSTESPEEGESMQLMAIRTFNDSPPLNDVETTQISRRFILCENASVKDAEVHGLLDDTTKVDPSFYATLASKDKPLAVESIPSIPPPIIEDPDRPLGMTDYAILAEGGVLPYLPDPLCVEIAARIFGIPGYSENTIIPIPLYNFTGSWPDALPFKVRLFDDPNAMPEYKELERVLHIPLPKACRAKLRLSVKPDKPILQLMGVWQWLSTAEQQKLEKRALDGQHWMITPWREIELVHAVQKPLITPELTIQMIREENQTWAIPRYTTPLSLKSTEIADLMARWNEPSLDQNVLPDNIIKTDRAFSVKVSEKNNYRGKPEHQILKPDLIRAGSKGNSKLVDKVHEFEDTRYRRIEYWLVATSRFREYMPENILVDNTVVPAVLTDQNIKVQSPPVVDWVPSSAPPPAPEVLYTVPTYQWVRSKSKGKQHSLRRGWGLRVYLDRPWNVSGYGEMLAVVLPGDEMAGEDPNLKPGSQPIKNFVTQWGNDPAWLSSFVAGPAPKASDFNNARTAPDPQGSWLPDFAPNTEADQPAGQFETNNLVHPQVRTFKGLSNQGKLKRKVNIAPHDVYYDEQRDLWFCDIDISPKTAYYPFIRLALARYQPVSLPNNHLSNIVLADFATLANDRSITITPGNTPLIRTVEVFGTSYSDSSGHQESLTAPMYSLPIDGQLTLVKAADVEPKTIVEVWVERLDPALGEDFGWKKDTASKLTKTAKPVARKIPESPAQKARLATLKKRARALQKAGDYQALQKENLLQYVLIIPTLWRGQVTLPKGADNPNSKIRRRLVIAEYEEYFIDDDAPYDLTPSKKGRRMVFVEHIEL
ncbi:hypothetical protein [Aliiglaciecola sp. M165]|uniref:hypothetical protein n=1 Tax=Aliiglaciecola sp. M165 TaxID=2593649 RepID=UPI00117CE102|nr:hypothetical protein [Aliiglaciecola sp. M165]TRY31955.1 hypothetical protein FM019_08975 [Aliiglaciecola sp. M165]